MHKQLIKISIATAMLAAHVSLYPMLARVLKPSLGHTTKILVRNSYTVSSAPKKESEGSYISGAAWTLGCGTVTSAAMFAVTGDPFFSLITMPLGTVAVPAYACEFKRRTFNGTIVVNGVVLATVAAVALQS